MNITREELIDFLKSDIVNACHIFDGDYSKAADVFFEKFGEEELKKVYLVTTGDYSDYRVVSVCSNKEQAEALSKHPPINRDIEDFLIDQYRESVSAGRVLYFIEMLRSGDTIKCVIKDGSGFDFPDVGGIWVNDIVKYQKGITGCFFGKDEQHAIKVANEFRLRMIAEGKL